MKINSDIKHPYFFRQSRGFSLLEMVIVLGIMGFILAGAIFSMGRIGDSAKVSTTDSSMSSLMTNLESYKNLGGTYPSQNQGLEALLVRPTSAPKPRRWNQALDKESALNDAWGNKYQYKFPGSKNPNRPEIISAGPDGQFGNEDDQSSQDE